MPQHIHFAQVSTVDTGGNDNPTGRVPGGAAAMWHTPESLTSMNPGTITNVGGSQAHQNMQPYLTLTFCIALQGIFPSPN